MAASDEQMKPKEALVAYMVAAGLGDAEIIRRLGVKPHVLKVLRGSPLFVELVAEIQQEFRASLLRELLDRMLGEADAALDTIADLRDGARSEAVKLSAATAILDRVAARKSQVDETRIIKIILEEGETRRMKRVLGEAHVVEARALPDGDDN